MEGNAKHLVKGAGSILSYFTSNPSKNFFFFLNKTGVILELIVYSVGGYDCSFV